MAATSTIVLVLVAAATANAQCDFSRAPTVMSFCYFKDNACGTPDPSPVAENVAKSGGTIDPTRPNCWELNAKTGFMKSIDAEFYSCNNTTNTAGFDTFLNQYLTGCALAGECLNKATMDCAFTNTNTNTTTNTGDAHRNQPSTLLAMLYIFIPMGLIPAAVAACVRR